MLYDWVAFLLIGAVAVAIGAAAGTTSQLRLIRNVLVAGIVMRIAGVLARYSMIFDFYDGGSDAVAYFDAGRVIADHLRALDFSIIGSGLWGDREWGTQAIRYATGFVMTVVGPSMRGTFLVFSLSAFVGLACTAVAFGRAHEGRSMKPAAILLFFWPTLWFWPSSIGKEAILLLAVGLATLGYVGHRERIHWLPMTAGLALAMAIRPHVAGVIAVAMCAAEWTSREWTLRRLSQSVVLSAAALWLVASSLELLGLGDASLDSMQAFVAHTAAQTNQGGSAIDQSGPATAIPMAFINLLCRPFITEANSLMALVSSLEMMAFWALVLRNLPNLPSVLRAWQVNRLLRFVLPFVVLYILMLGLTFQNLGIIARQRALVMPALLVIVAASTVVRRTRTSAPAMRRVWRASDGSPIAVAGR